MAKAKINAGTVARTQPGATTSQGLCGGPRSPSQTCSRAAAILEREAQVIFESNTDSRGHFEDDQYGAHAKAEHAEMVEHVRELLALAAMFEAGGFRQ